MTEIPYQQLTYSDVEAPVLEIKLSDPLGINSTMANAIIDTGFDAELIIPIGIYQTLQLQQFELSKDQFSIAETASGEQLQLVSAYGIVEIPSIDLELDVLIDAHVKCQEILIGRKFLQEFNLSLFGKKSTFTINLSD